MNTWIAGSDYMKHYYQIIKSCYSKLYLEDITDKGYTHTQKVFKELGLKNLGDYHDLYVQSDTLLLADVFEDFRINCIRIYELHPAYFLSGLTWQACFKKGEVELELLTDMLLMVEKGIRGRICHAIHRYAKANNKYMKNYDKNIEHYSAECNSIRCNSVESSYLMYLDANNLCEWGTSQKLSVNDFKWV